MLLNSAQPHARSALLRHHRLQRPQPSL